MRITDIEVHLICPPYCDFNALQLARYHGAWIQRRAIYVVYTDDGLEGLGESIGHGPELDVLREKYIATSPFDWLNDESNLAVNMACYDLMGKKLGLPAWKLIGPQYRAWIPVAAWTVAQQPQAMAEEVRQAAAKGYHWIKYHVDEMQDVIAQTEAMQQAAPPHFKVHYDFNANSNYYTMRPILNELLKFPIAGRFEDVVQGTDEDAYRMLREQCPLPIIGHHVPREAMSKRYVDGTMAGHAPIGNAVKDAAVAERMNMPLMYQQTGGTINQAFLAHEVAVFKMATIDHVNGCHLWSEDVVKEKMPVVDGSVAVPNGPGLGVELDREKLARWTDTSPVDKGRFLIRIRSAGGPTAYVRHDPEPAGSADNLRYHERLHGQSIPGRPASYANPLTSEFWDAEKDPEHFEDLWQATADGPIWKEER